MFTLLLSRFSFGLSGTTMITQLRKGTVVGHVWKTLQKWSYKFRKERTNSLSFNIYIFFLMISTFNHDHNNFDLEEVTSGKL